LDHLAHGHLIEPMGMPDVFGVFLGQVTLRDDAKFLAIDFTQKSERGLAQARPAMKSRRRIDDPPQWHRRAYPDPRRPAL
jgi:hypothetical protein